MKELRLLKGNEAVAEGAIRAGLGLPPGVTGDRNASVIMPSLKLHRSGYATIAVGNNFDRAMLRDVVDRLPIKPDQDNIFHGQVGGAHLHRPPVDLDQVGVTWYGITP